MIRIAPAARRDLTACLAYLDGENPVAASALGERVLALIAKLAEGGFDGPEQVLRNGRRVRSWPLPPLRIYYRRTSAGDLEIMRIYHQARRPITK